MSTSNTQSLNNEVNQNKVKHFSTQIKTIFEYLKENTATNTMVSVCTGVPQKSICRYKRELEKQNLLVEVEKKPCKITGFNAWYLSTNSNMMVVSNQLKMF